MIFIKKHFLITILVLLSFFPVVTLLAPGLPVTHDGQDHVARIANFYQSLQDGNIIPRWAANLNWEYGHPILMFLYPLPSYLASFMHFLGFNLVDSVKLVFGISFILSGLAMYLWMKSEIGKMEGFFAAFLYMFAPYRFVDFYVRGAIGEHMAFVFPPLIFYFLHKLRNSSSSLYLVFGSLSVAGLILSHNAVSLMFIPIIFLYIFYGARFSKNKKVFLLQAIMMILWGFLLSAFFWIPALFEGKYTLRDIVTKNEYATRFVQLKDLLYGEWNYGGTGQFTVQIGVVQWIMVSISVLLLIVKKNRKYVLPMVGLLTIFIITLFLMLPISDIIWQKITLLQKFQFPWRLLSVEVFVTAVLGALVIAQIKHKKYVVIASVILGLILLRPAWQADGYLLRSESFYSGIYYSTTDTGESSPIWSIRFMEHTPRAHIEVIDGEAMVQEVSRLSTSHVYKVNAVKNSRIRENTVYFPGWTVFVNGKPVPVEFQDQANRGLITFFVDKGESMIEVKFIDTKIRYFSNIVSFLAFISMILYLFYNRKIWRVFR